MRLYDLTRPLEPGMAVYPGDPPVRFLPHATYRTSGFRVTALSLGTHAGTHLDAPAHFIPRGTTVDALPLPAVIGPARVLEGDGPRLPISPGERLIVRSRWGAQWGADDYFTAFPAIPAWLAHGAAEAPAALVGVETPSLHPDPEEDARLHRLLLSAGVVLVENLAGVADLPRSVFLAALPLPLRGLDGSPCRVVAWEVEA